MEQSHLEMFALSENEAEVISKELFSRMGNSFASTLTKKRAASKNNFNHKCDPEKKDLASACYELRMHCNTHLSMATVVEDLKCVSDSDFFIVKSDVSEDGITKEIDEEQIMKNKERGVSEYALRYPHSMRFNGEENLPDLSNNVR